MRGSMPTGSQQLVVYIDVGTSLWMPGSSDIVRVARLLWTRCVDCPAVGVCTHVELIGTGMCVVTKRRPLVVL